MSIDTKNRKYPKDIIASPRIGIPNKGDWTHKSLRYTVKGNPFVSRMRKSDCMSPKILEINVIFIDYYHENEIYLLISQSISRQHADGVIVFLVSIIFFDSSPLFELVLNFKI